MKKISLQITLFMLPIIALFTIPVLILWKTGEYFQNIKATLHSDQKYFIGYSYDEHKYIYIKWCELESKPKYNIVALGSSRVLQFRKEMFDSSFYNAGYTIFRVNDFKTFLEYLPKDKYPDYLIINIDQWMFNEEWDIKHNHNYKNPSDQFEQTPNFKTILNVYSDLFKKKFDLSILDKKNSHLTIGLRATIGDCGFRNDGSVYYGDALIKNDTTREDYAFKDTFKRIMEGNRRFEYGDKLDVKAINQLDMCLNYCKKNRIQVIGFLPPFADAVNEKMKSIGKYKYMDKLTDELNPVFKKYDYEFYDFSHLNRCHSNDTEVVDGFHGGELTYAKILATMLEQGSRLNKLTNLKRLKNDINNARNRYVVYDY